MGDNRIGKELGSALRGVLDRDPRLFKEMIGATGLARRKAHYFVNICRAFDLLPIPRARLNALGWIKLQMLAGHIEADNADTLLKMAETNTTARLCKLLKREKSSANRRSLIFCFGDSDFETLADALAKFGGVVTGDGMENKEESLIALVKAAQTNAVMT